MHTNYTTIETHLDLQKYIYIYIYIYNLGMTEQITTTPNCTSSQKHKNFCSFTGSPSVLSYTEPFPESSQAERQLTGSDSNLVLTIKCQFGRLLGGRQSVSLASGPRWCSSFKRPNHKPKGLLLGGALGPAGFWRPKKNVPEVAVLVF